MKTNLIAVVSSLARTQSLRLTGLLLALVLARPAAATTLELGISDLSAGNESNRTAFLTWTAEADKIYRVQSSTNLADPAAWKTEDAVSKSTGVPIKWSAPEAIRDQRYYRLLLPQPDIFSVEPAVFAPGVAVEAFMVGQCFESNDVVRVDGVPVSGVIFVNSGLLRFTCPPQTEGEHQVELIRPSVSVSVIVTVRIPESSLQGPPSEPPASPQGSSKIFAGKKGYDMYNAKKSYDMYHATALEAKGNARIVTYEYDTSTSVAGGRVRKGMQDIKNLAQERSSSRDAEWEKWEGIAAGGDDCDDNDSTVAAAGREFVEDFRYKVDHKRVSGGGGVRFSGEVQDCAVDLVIPGRGLDFIWARTYRSRANHAATILGNNRWSLSYDVSVEQGTAGITVNDGTGRTDTFKLQTNGTYTCPEFFREGTISNNTFTLTFADTGRWVFNPFDGTAAAGKLRQIITRNGDTMTLGYDTSGRLTSVVDDLGRTNSVGYDSSGRVASVTDFSGRTVTYQYYQGLPADQGGAGDLKSVTSPPVTGTPNGNDFPQGKTTSYTYTKGYPLALDAQNHLLLSCVDALGTPVEQFSYDLSSISSSYLRCISVQRWTNTPTMISYLPQTPTPANQFATLRCIVNDPVGNVSECFTDARGRCVKSQEFTGRATPGVAVTGTQNRPTGKLRAEDPDYYECRASWNNDSLCNRMIMFGGQQVQCLYECDFDKSTRARKRADCRVVREIASSPVDLDGDGVADVTERSWHFDYDPRFGSAASASGGGHHYVNANGLPFALSIPSAAYHAVKTKGTGANLGKSTGDDSFLKQKHISNIKWTAGRPPIGFITLATDPRGNVTAASYDTQGNSVQWEPHKSPGLDLPEQQFTYNSYGQLTAITNVPDGSGYRRVDAFKYYTNGPQAGYLQSCVVDAGVGGLALTESYEYDERGNLTSHTDARGNQNKFHNNALNQCVRVETPTNLTASCATDFFYDANDNLVQCATEVRSETDALLGSKVDRCVVDPLHRLTEIALAVDATHALTNRFVYDGNDQCVLALGGDAVSGADPHQAVAYQYDERRMLFREISAPGSPVQSTTQCDYDANGLVTRVSEGLEGTPSVTTMEYDGFIGNAASGGWTGFTTASRLKVWQLMQGQNSTAAMRWTPVVPKPQQSCRLKVWQLMQGQNGSQAMRENKPIVEKEMMRCAKITDPMGNVTTCAFDACDNLKVVRVFGQTNDVPGSTGNIRLAESRYDYDGLNRCVRSHDLFFDPTTQAAIGDGDRTTTCAYAPNDTCLSITDDLGHTTSFGYDTASRLVLSASDGSKTVVLQLRDQAGNVTRCTQTDVSDLGGSPQVFAWTNVYDNWNRCVSTTDNVGNRSHCAYDSLGRAVVLFNPKEYSVSRSYDLLGRCTLTVTDLDGDGLFDLANDSSSACVWSSSSDQLLATIDSHGNPTTYAYDSLSRCTQVTQADGTQQSLVWSPRSNLILETDANGSVISNSYNLKNKLVHRDIAARVVAGVAATTTFENFAYDGCSRLVAADNDVSSCTFSYDSHGNQTRGVSGGLGALATFDSVGRCVSLTYPGGRALTYAYDSQDRCTNIFEFGSSLASFDYDGPDRVARISYANGMRTRIFYDGISGTPNATGDFGHGQVRRIRHAVAGASPIVSEVTLAWDRNQNKIGRQTAIFAPAIPGTNSMFLTYDPADRLTRAAVLAGTTLMRDTIYGLDREGNRTNVIGAASCSGSYFMDAAVPGPLDFQMNQYTATPCESRSYDDNGNLVSRSSAAGPVTYQFDYAGRLVLVQALNFNTGAFAPVASYAYDALGRRIAKTVFDNGGLPPVTTQFYYDGDSVIEERKDGVPTVTYVSPPCCGAGACVTMRRNGQDYFFHNDDQGNTLALTTTGAAVAERYDYDDYGAVTFLTSDGIPTSATSSSVGNVYCWGGLRLDAETGLYNDDGGGYQEPTSARYLFGLRGTALTRGASANATVGDNNPWSKSGMIHLHKENLVHRDLAARLLFGGENRPVTNPQTTLNPIGLKPCSCSKCNKPKQYVGHITLIR